jgi:membrane protein implicated in regulation of membrane protease activity
MIGRTVIVRRTGDVAQARVDGSWWRLRADDAEQLDDGAEAVVESVDGLELVVRRAPSSPAGEDPQPPERSEEHP